MKNSKNGRQAESMSKKKTAQQITEKLETTFAFLLPVLGKKKFNKRVKKARKVLLYNLNGTAIKVSGKPSKTKADKTFKVEQ